MGKQGKIGRLVGQKKVGEYWWNLTNFKVRDDIYTGIAFFKKKKFENQGKFRKLVGQEYVGEFNWNLTKLWRILNCGHREISWLGKRWGYWFSLVSPSQGIGKHCYNVTVSPENDAPSYQL